jgi:hypothetical protein
MDRPQKNCIFCGNAPTTKEDVWPTWLTKFIPRNVPRYTSAASIINEAGGVISTKKQVDGDPRSRRAKCVCASCNNGWTSELQNSAKRIVLPLAQGQAATISPDDQELLAAWVSMGVMTSEYFNPSKAAVSSADREFLWRHKTAPKGWKVWIGNFSRISWPPYRVHHAWPVLDDECSALPLPVTAPPNTQTTTLVFGQLYVHAASSDLSEVITRLGFSTEVESTLFRRIRPALGVPIAWPPRHVMDDQDADNAAGFIFLSATGLLWKEPVRIR